MDRINIWFNRTFATTYHSIQELKGSDLPFRFRVYGTHSNLSSTFLQACDHVEAEPGILDESYIDFVIDFIRRHGIHVFVPGEFSLLVVSRHRERIESTGVRVMISADFDTMELISSKSQTYAALDGLPGLQIPEYQIVQDAGSFREACMDIARKGKMACFKPDVSQGGMGFWIVNDRVDRYSGLFQYPTHQNTLDYFHDILTLRPSIPPLIVMEYLPSGEVSIDCLSASGRLLHAVPRTKRGNMRIVEGAPDLVASSEAICRRLELNYLSNIQYRMDREGRSFLLEVNARPSAGLYYAQLAGHGMITEAMRLLLTGETGHLPKVERRVLLGYDHAVPYQQSEGGC